MGTLALLGNALVGLANPMSFLLLVAGVAVGIVFGSTVFTRTGTIRQYELVPFWSWRDIIRYHDRQLLKENFLNCILLFPAGALLPLIIKRAAACAENSIYEINEMLKENGITRLGVIRHYCNTRRIYTNEGFRSKNDWLHGRRR